MRGISYVKKETKTSYKDKFFLFSGDGTLALAKRQAHQIKGPGLGYSWN